MKNTSKNSSHLEDITIPKTPPPQVITEDSLGGGFAILIGLIPLLFIFIAIFGSN